MANSSDDSLEDKFRRVATSIERLIAWVMRRSAEKAMGIGRIGVFGSHASGGKEVIDCVAEQVSGLGHPVITARGYLLPKAPKDIRPVSDFAPPFLRKLIDELSHESIFPTSDYIFYRVLPQIGDKAVINLGISAGGGQLIEWQSCVDNNVPVLGFVVREEIARNSLQNCDYLAVQEKYSECMAPDLPYCVHSRFCPFLDDPTSLSTIVTGVFLKRENQMLVAVRGAKDLTPALEKFLT